MIAADEELIKGKMKQLGMLEDPPPHICYILELTLKIKGPHTTTSKYCLINYAYFRPHQQRSKSKFGSTCTIYEC